MDRRRMFEINPALACLLLASIYGFACRNALGAAENAGLSIGALKQLSIEELMNLDVTSVSKQPEPYGERRQRFKSSPTTKSAARAHRAFRKRCAWRTIWTWRSRILMTGPSARVVSTPPLLPINSWYWSMAGRFIRRSFPAFFWNVQDYLLEDVDRIEVISGPGGTLWVPMPSTASSTSAARARRTRRGVISRPAAGSPD